MPLPSITLVVLGTMSFTPPISEILPSTTITEALSTLGPVTGWTVTFRTRNVSLAPANVSAAVAISRM